jgi:hypothetical protein
LRELRRCLKKQLIPKEVLQHSLDEFTAFFNP